MKLIFIVLAFLLKQYIDETEDLGRTYPGGEEPEDLIDGRRLLEKVQKEIRLR